jgi:hypothetical protein
MKKLLFVAAFLMVSVMASAQMWIGGSMNCMYQKDKDFNNGVFTFGVAPEVGYGINDKFTVAMAIGYRGQFASGITSNSFFMQPYARYHIVNFGNAGFFIDGGLEYGLNAYKDDFMNRPAYTHHVYVGVWPGFAYAFCDKAVIAARFGFLGYKYNGTRIDGIYDANAPADTPVNHSFGFDFANGVSLAVYFNL